MNWTRERPGMYECEAGMVVRDMSDPAGSDIEWLAMAWRLGGVNVLVRRGTMHEAKAAVEAHAKEAAGRG